MALTVYGAMKLNALKNFTLVAGHLGLDRKVTRTGILDYEFTGKVPDEIANQFAPGEFILSSMLYADQDEAALLAAVKKLIELKVAALAIKTIFFKALPESVQKLANEERFPIFLFDNSTFFEDVIAEIADSVRLTDRFHQLEARLDTLIYRDLSREDIRSLSMELNRDFRKHVVVFYGRPRETAELLEPERLHEAYQRNRFRGQENLLAGYRGGVMIFITADEADSGLYPARLQDVLSYGGLAGDRLAMGSSGVYDALDGLSTAIREAVWAQKVAAARCVELVSFETAGIYRLLLPHLESLWSEAYWKQFLNPLMKQDASAGTELMKTATAYVQCEGSLKKAAERLFVHENTVRYRINNIHRLLCPEAGELSFYEQLSAAVRLYTLKMHNRCL